MSPITNAMDHRAPSARWPMAFTRNKSADTRLYSAATARVAWRVRLWVGKTLSELQTVSNEGWRAEIGARQQARRANVGSLKPELEQEALEAEIQQRYREEAAAGLRIHNSCKIGLVHQGGVNCKADYGDACRGDQEQLVRDREAQQTRQRGCRMVGRSAA
jgi:hypothetical protein